ncbi:MAG: zinc metalloprotease [Thermoplasmataceae archaeon]
MDEEYERIKEIISSLYEFSETKNRGSSFYFRIPELSSYPEEKFSLLVDKLSDLGYVVFTSGLLGEELFVIKRISRHQGRKAIKLTMLALTVASLWYAGYSYQAQYTGSLDYAKNLATALVLFVFPILAVLGFRELARFVAFRRNRMRYELPMFIPDPLGIGTMGVINLPSHPFKTRRALLEAGSFPIVAGFIGSVALILVGNFVIPSSTAFTPTVNSPINTVSLPLIYPLLLNVIYPVSAVPNIIAYSGWVALVINSFNAVPAGFLDGGLISVGLFGKYSRYISYVSIIALVVLGITYPPWIILAVFVLVLGIRGPEPLNNVYRPLPLSRAVAVLAILVLFIGIVPFPFHLSENQIAASVQDPNYLIVNGTAVNATFELSVTDIGISSIVPAFIVTPSIGYTFYASSDSPISPGSTGKYSVTLDTWTLNSTGYHNYTLRTYYGGSSSDSKLSILVIQYSSLITMGPNNHNPRHPPVSNNETVNISIVNTGDSGLVISTLIFTNANNSYNYSISNLSRSASGSGMIIPPATIPGPGTVSFSITPIRVYGNMTIIAIDQKYDAAVEYLYFP